MKRIILAAALAFSFAAVPASACPGVCVYNGQDFSEGARSPNGRQVCQCTGNQCRWYSP